MRQFINWLKGLFSSHSVPVFDHNCPRCQQPMRSDQKLSFTVKGVNSVMIHDQCVYTKPAVTNVEGVWLEHPIMPGHGWEHQIGEFRARIAPMRTWGGEYAWWVVQGPAHLPPFDSFWHGPHREQSPFREVASGDTLEDDNEGSLEKAKEEAEESMEFHLWEFYLWKK